HNPHTPPNPAAPYRKLLRTSIDILKCSQIKINLPIGGVMPGVLNGLADYVGLKRWIKRYKNQTKQLFKILYGNMGKSMYDTLMSELYYIEDKCFKSISCICEYVPKFDRQGYETLSFFSVFVKTFVFISKNERQALNQLLNAVEPVIKKSENYKLKDKFSAINVLVEMYLGHNDVADTWLKECTINEYEGICLLDIFCYFVKLRIYIRQGNYCAGVSLASLMRQPLEMASRKTDIAELDILCAINAYANNENEKAFAYVDSFYDYIKKNKLYRLVANEGKIMYSLLSEYSVYKKCTDDIFIKKIMALSRTMGEYYPKYFNIEKQKINLTKKEKAVLRMVIDNRTNKEIAVSMYISENTVKFHMKNIILKLGVKNRRDIIRLAKKIDLD
ncbi:MAG: helix-turn-helix transcriptional regulator, partial [Ruminococcus sp.]|nr:helix-turn-helix transcriptional regulator [Ruminococcus sp.]